MPDKIFLIDYNKLALLMLPTFLRKVKMFAWLQVLITPIKMLYADFMNRRNANLYNLAHNGQVCYLRKVLNDSFDPTLRRIYIGDGNRYTRNYIYTNGEQQPKYLGTMYLRQAEDYADTGLDFRVIVPDDFDINAVYHQMKATIDFYKLAGKRYKIEHENE